MHNEKNVEDIYIAHVDLVYRYIFLLVHNKEIAEDLTQETFIKVFRHLSKFNDLSNLKTWIIKIAKNTTYDYFKKNRWSTFNSKYHNNVTDTILLPPEEELVQKNEVEILYQALLKLKRDYKEVIILRKINEFSTKETAIILGWSENKVKVKLAYYQIHSRIQFI